MKESNENIGAAVYSLIEWVQSKGGDDFEKSAKVANVLFDMLIVHPVDATHMFVGDVNNVVRE